MSRRGCGKGDRHARIAPSEIPIDLFWVYHVSVPHPQKSGEELSDRRIFGRVRSQLQTSHPLPHHHLVWCFVVKLPRSRSSPSPPARRPAGRADHPVKRARLPSARRQSHSSKVRPVPAQALQQQGWSTSYQAGSSRYVLVLAVGRVKGCSL